MRTEFYELDKLVNLDKPQLILLGARPGMEKSTIALNIGTNIALHQNMPVLFFTLEENYLNSNSKELDYDELMKPSDDLPFNCMADKIISAEEMIRKDYFKKIRKPYSYIEDKLEIDEKELLKIIDTILLLYRDEYYNYDTEMKSIAELYVAKNNDGYTEKIDLVYLSEYFKFVNLEKNILKTTIL